MSAPPATRLTDSQLAALREQAARASSSFVDPAQLTRVEKFVAGRHDWASAVLGKSFILRAMTNLELVLLDLAATAEPAPPEPPRPPAPWEPGYQPTDADRAAAARGEAAARAWAQLARALPVRVSVAYNYSGPHHYEFHVSGAEHIIVREQLHAGRLHRDADHALCETPSRAKHLLFTDLDGFANEGRTPTCKACLRTAYRITGLDPDNLLLHPEVA